MMLKVIRYSLVLLLTLLLAPLFSSSGYAASLSSTVDRTDLNSGETFELSVIYSGQTGGEPNFSALNHQFEIINKSQQSQVSMINGNVTSTTTWHLTLLPKGPGAALIPTFHFKGETSDAIELTVREDSDHLSDSLNSDKPLFAEVVLDKNDLYVQEQALLTIRLYTRVSLNGYSHSDLKVNNARIIKVSENQQYRKKIGGEDYVVVESRYALFPERSGEVEIPSLRFSVSVVDNRSRFDSFFDNRGKTTYLHSKPQILEVKPAPPLQGVDQWLPARQVMLSQSWHSGNSTDKSDRDSFNHSSPDKNKVLLGEPITRTVTITAEGLNAAQLPPLTFDQNGNYRLYPDQAITEDEPVTHGLIGKRVEAMAIVPTQAGTLHLPEIKLSWWDTEAERVREAVAPGKTFEVLPAPGINIKNSADSNRTSGPAETQASDHLGADKNKPVNHPLNLWLLVSNGLLLLTTLIFAMLWRHRASTSKPVNSTVSATQNPDSSRAFKALILAANTDTLGELRTAILHWARLHWDTKGILTLQQVAAKAPQLPLTQHFNWLDKNMYSGAENRQADESSEQMSAHLTELLELLKQLNQDSASEKTAKGSTLQALYPQ